MGRQAHLQRIAFGRSSYDHPSRLATGADPSNTRQSQEELEHSNHYRHHVQQYGDRGHPVNPESRAQARRVRNASNDVLSVIGVVERKTDADNGAGKISAKMLASSEEENGTGAALTLAGLYLHDMTCWWTAGLANRLLVFGYTESSGFTTLVASQIRSMGLTTFMFTGLFPAFTAGTILNPTWLAHLAMYQVDRMVMATISSRRSRAFYTDYIKPPLSAFVEVCSFTAIFPLRLHSLLQTLGMASEHRLLPSWRQCIPFSAASPLQTGGNTPLPIMLLFLYAPLVSQLHAWLAEKLPIDFGGLPDDRLVTYMRGHVIDSSVTEIIEDTMPYPGEDHAELASQPTSDLQEPNAAAEVPSTTPPARIQRTNTTFSIDEPTTTPGLDAGPQVSIRISSYDPASATVNLEIGVPEEVMNGSASPRRRNGGSPSSRTRNDQAAGQESQQDWLDVPSFAEAARMHSSPPFRETVLTDDLAPTARLSDELGQHALQAEGSKQLPTYRLSALHLASQETLFSIRNHALLTIAILPIKAYIIRGVASHYLTSLVSPGARSYTGSSSYSPKAQLPTPSFFLGLRAAPGGSFIIPAISTAVVGKVLLAALSDLAMGTAIAWTQYWVCRWVGGTFFGWGGSSSLLDELEDGDDDDLEETNFETEEEMMDDTVDLSANVDLF